VSDTGSPIEGAPGRTQQLDWAFAAALLGLLVTLGLFLYEVRQIRECIRLRSQAGAVEELMHVPDGAGQFRDAPPLHFSVLGVELGSWTLFLSLLSTWAYFVAVGSRAVSDSTDDPWIAGPAWMCGAAAAVVLAGRALLIVRRARRLLPLEEQIAGVLREDGPLTAAQLANRLDLDICDVVEALVGLVRRRRYGASSRASVAPGPHAVVRREPAGASWECVVREAPSTRVGAALRSMD
jgi:hypothetical protein